MRRWEDEICNYCLTELPLTYFEQDPENLVAQVFWGRVHLEQATSFFFFHKGSIYQSAIHQLKYEERPGIGISLGREFGYQLQRSKGFIIPDVVMPVPLHSDKMKKRGYNQSETIGRGVSEALDIPIICNVLLKVEKTSTQTDKSRFDRYLNVAGSFALENDDTIKGRHIFLIDDVLTTGATLEACAEKLLEVEGIGESRAALICSAWKYNHAARGLMQLIKDTACDTAKNVGVKCRISKLTTDPKYNMRLGSNHLNCNYIMS